MFTIAIMYAFSWENVSHTGGCFFFFYKGICHCKNEPPKISSPRNWNNYTSNRQSNCTSDSKWNLFLLRVQLFSNCTSDSRYINPAQNKRVSRTASLLLPTKPMTVPRLFDFPCDVTRMRKFDYYSADHTLGGSHAFQTVCLHGRGTYIILESIRLSAYSPPSCRAVEQHSEY